MNGIDGEQNVNQEVDNMKSKVESYYDSEYEFENEFVQEDINFAIETNKDRYQQDEEIKLSLVNRGTKEVIIPDAIDIYTFTDGRVQWLEKETHSMLQFIEPSDSYTPNYEPHEEIRDYFGENNDLSGAYILSVEFEYNTGKDTTTSEKIGKLIYIE
ncbi:hypothetical protein [Bacillus piscicola]|nr:hypothetical protein [Bacillus piscicola]